MNTNTTSNIRCIKRANTLGYCMGVRKAVESVKKALADYPYAPVYTYGALIHNPVTMRFLAKKGVGILDTEKPLRNQLTDGAVVVIRAHGIAPKKREELIDFGACIIDATCPRVIASQKKAMRYAQQGYTVILAGSKKHGEIKGIAGCVAAVSKKDCFIVETAQEAVMLSIDTAPAVLLAQTTMQRTTYCEIAAILQKKHNRLSVLETICAATNDRQLAVTQLTREVDAIIIVGGSQSANTKGLLHTAQAKKPAWLVETPENLPSEIFRYDTVGIAAGASTPDVSIDAVEQALLFPL